MHFLKQKETKTSNGAYIEFLFLEQNCKCKKVILISCNKIYNQINYTKEPTDIYKIKYCPPKHKLLLKLKIKSCKKGSIITKSKYTTK